MNINRTFFEFMMSMNICDIGNRRTGKDEALKIHSSDHLNYGILVSMMDLHLHLHLHSPAKINLELETFRREL